MAKQDRITTLNISLPTSQRRFIEDDVAKRGFASLSEYFRELIRERQKRNGVDETTSDRESARAAVRSILELQKKLSLKGISIEDLIGEGRDP
jgi:Arc/MetJ-type ribon-helix-helix transcriptional regulator